MLVVTDAIVLHAFDYLETSRILRLLTRDAGVQSVLAKGARRNRGKFGSGIDLFAEGEAQIYIKPTRELQTIAAFEVVRGRAELALNMDRFMAASAVAELVLKLGSEEANPTLYDGVAATFDALAKSSDGDVAVCALGGLWRIVAAAGFAPALDQCANCHAALNPELRLAFSHRAGGALCERCARGMVAVRAIPPEARQVVGKWLTGDPGVSLTGIEARAHQRLFREFVSEHFSDDRSMRAYIAWEADHKKM
jgi:DNA repair protein RecO (recombination protein O)